MATRGRPKSQRAEVSDNPSGEGKADDEKVVTAQTQLGGATQMKRETPEIPTNAELLLLIEQLTSKLERLKNAENEQAETPYESGELDNLKDLRQDDYITVISLTPHQLNLSTEEYGKGRHFTFRTFGETKRILYSDLTRILEVYGHFLKNGLFYIADRRVIRAHGLDELYATILDKDKMEAILHGKNNSITIAMFKSASKGQKEIIVQMLLDKRIQGEEIDLNLWDIIARDMKENYNIDIQERYESTKEYVDFMNKKD